MGRLEDLDTTDIPVPDEVPTAAPLAEPQPGSLKIRSYSIAGVELRGWEVAVFAESGVNAGRWRALKMFLPSKKGADKAAKYAETEFKRLGGIIRVRPVVSIDPSTLAGEDNGLDSNH